MENIRVRNEGDDMIISINKKSVGEKYLMTLLKRLQIEELALKGQVSESIQQVAEEINASWWSQNKDSFLKK